MDCMAKSKGTVAQSGKIARKSCPTASSCFIIALNQLIRKLHRGISVVVIAAHGTVSLVMMTPAVSLALTSVVVFSLVLSTPAVGLDLSSSFLSGFINTSSTLFHLAHHQTLKLADNYFNESQIPFAVGLLSRLIYLNLSYTEFAGQMPLEFSNLTKLNSLDLSRNSKLKLLKPGLTSLVQNVMNLKELYLNEVNISCTVSHILANFSSLTSLHFESCQLQGEFPADIFKLPNLQFLSVHYNPDLNGYLPEFSRRSLLKELILARTNFFGELPNSIGYLESLNHLDISYRNFSGSMLSSISNLSQLLHLKLSGNNFSAGSMPPWIGNITQLERLYMSSTQLTGQIPSWLMNLTQLTLLDLSYNMLHGPIPESISTYFLKTQDELQQLNLSNNRIQGPLPTWIWNMSTQTLSTLDLSQNFITGFHQPPPLALPWGTLRILDLSLNKLQGSLPVPPSSTLVYNVANNKLTGQIPLLICNASSLDVLDLSYNILSGIIPQCLANFSDRLTLLNLRNNKLGGPIPQTYKNGTQLTMINLSQNQLVGPVPRSLINCSLLESLDLGNNQINDIFPFWLGTLSESKILILRFNRFHGAIRNPDTSFAFPKLQILDVSHNGFTSKLPSDYFQTWTAMKTTYVNQSAHTGRIE
ncbi:receptor-like protein 7 [Cornus florida]|uniref:receptor-like protein 7 n=1 Tax=Cornus florida TaxID=4283 RepID=UPI0028A0E0D1|nr:receptor-like protein 7 [Cornus florida]